ncbi:CLUMA_CG001427, isoform A [Clunio marinus]|uniref:CLUMA_CG001427, isoform A n=1 Tax=Clunio marinus TaxID=568069 RepID=A0A1J1HHW8_9DIPT|nr:CLUMA_CG001427, isoform A [Clunio marinus]
MNLEIICLETPFYCDLSMTQEDLKCCMGKQVKMYEYWIFCTSRTEKKFPHKTHCKFVFQSKLSALLHNKVAFRYGIMVSIGKKDLWNRMNLTLEYEPIIFRVWSKCASCQSLIKRN